MLACALPERCSCKRLDGSLLRTSAAVILLTLCGAAVWMLRAINTSADLALLEHVILQEEVLPYGLVRLRISEASIHVVRGTGYRSRNLSVDRLCRLAFEKHIKNTIPGKTADFIVHTGDHFNPDANFSFAVPQDSPHRCFPSFMFDGWPEIGIPDYETLFTDMQAAGSIPATHPQAIWLGARTHATRSKAVQWASRHKDMARFEMIAWNRTVPAGMHLRTPSYMSMPQQAREYSVQVDLRGAGFSARLPALLASGRPVIIQDRPHEQWFFWDAAFQPWTHYIPVRGDASDIGDAVQWAVDHPKQAAAIGRAGAEYARAYLTKEAVLLRVADLMRSQLR